MYKIVHLSKMADPFVGICKIYTDIFKMYKIVEYILPKCTILYILKKEGLLAPAIVIETVELSFLPTIATPHPPTTTHNHHPTISISSLTTHPPKPATTHHNDPPHTRQITHSTISPNYQPHPHLATRMMTASQTSMRRGRQG